MSLTKKDLRAEVDRLNKTYCSKTKNQFAIHEAYGGYQIVLVGKPRKNGNGRRGLNGAFVPITGGYRSARDTISDLYMKEARGWVKSDLKSYEKCSPYYRKK